MTRKQRSVTELRRRDLRNQYAAYRGLPNGSFIMISPIFPTFDLAEEWAERNLVGDYLVSNATLEEFN
jgi:hypothetical protein